MSRSDTIPVPTLRRRIAAWPSWGRRCLAAVTAIAATISFWRQRSRSRSLLATLDDHLLRDMGLSRVDAWRESDKPFWMP
jgi:uncharacterized protein YjiS (DUF1127 family)